MHGFALSTPWRRPRSGLVLVVVLAVLLGAAPAARAQNCSQSDVSAIDQYCEAPATADGGAPQPQSTPTLRDVLSPSEVKALDDLGDVGQLLLDLPVDRPEAAEALANLRGLVDRDLPSPGPAAVADAAAEGLRATASGLAGSTLLLGLGVASLTIIVGYAVARLRPF